MLVLAFCGLPATWPDVPTSDTRLSVDDQRYWVEEIAKGLRFPSSIAWLPNGDALITEREGGLRVLNRDRLDPHPIEGVPASYQSMFNGLKEVAVDPDFRSNGRIYLLLSEGNYDSHRTAVYRAVYGRERLTAVERIFLSRDEISGVAHSASRMLFLPDKTLLVAVPENNYYRQWAQRLDSHIGKILRINRDGSVPQDNPFIKTPNALPEIWSYGHRVPTGLYCDPGTGSIWEVEPGPKGGDELNLLKAGANFGWAKASWGFDYNGALVSPQQSAPDIEDPILVWMRMPLATPAGLTRYHGVAFPRWKGDFFVGHLAGRAVERLRIEDGKVVFRETLLADLEERIREVTVGPDERLYILTDHQEGRVLRLQPGRARNSPRSHVARTLDQPAYTGDPVSEIAVGDPEKGRQAFLERCAACHSVGTTIRGGQIGPDLAKVYDRKAGSQPGFGYSAAMAAFPQVWDRVSINQFIADPNRYVPGTTMLAPPVSDAEVRRHIVGFLKASSP